MKLKFKKQAYQTAAVEAVVNCFEGQRPIADPVSPFRRRRAISVFTFGGGGLAGLQRQNGRLANTRRMVFSTTALLEFHVTKVFPSACV